MVYVPPDSSLLDVFCALHGNGTVGDTNGSDERVNADSLYDVQRCYTAVVSRWSMYHLIAVYWMRSVPFMATPFTDFW